MWKEYLSNISKECTFRAPATEIELLLIEKELNINLPQKLIDFYHETNGVDGQYSIPFIWSTNQMVRDNLLVRNIEDGEFEGKGYASEGAKAFFEYLFMELGARRLYAYVEDDNFRSQKLCEKLGMRKEGYFLEFISFTKNEDGTPKYENTFQYALLKKRMVGKQS